MFACTQAGIRRYSNMPFGHEESQRLLASMPVRNASLHLCFSNTPVFQIYRAIGALLMIGGDNKMRLLTHLGTENEVKYKLLSFGVPVECKYGSDCLWFC